LRGLRRGERAEPAGQPRLRTAASFASGVPDEERLSGHLGEFERGRRRAPTVLEFVETVERVELTNLSEKSTALE
jgi:hypothetical protein